ncbi:hypothetical protein vBAmePPT11V19_00009 [Alteromonas phage vB_AmeP_PT11-V19]|nr:hypothetical protein vBAmePPT11V19_00009 [Alteromonas phage vB_AmeP_PT11-V19]
MSELLDLFSGGAIGTTLSGVIGLIGGWLAKKENRLLAKQQNDHEQVMAKLDMEAEDKQLQASIALADKEQAMAQQEGKIALDLLDAETKGKIEQIDAQGFYTATANAQKNTGHPTIDMIRALTRPVLTWLTYVFVVVLFFVLWNKVGDLVSKDTDLLIELLVYLVRSVIYLFVMIVSWWFMSRGDKSHREIKGFSN